MPRTANAPLKIDILLSLLRKGPCSIVTLMQKTGFRSKASLLNALVSIPDVHKISVDAGCRPLLVYWMQSDYSRRPPLRDMVPAVLKLRNQGLTLKQAMRQLKIEANPDALDKACRDYKRRPEAAE